MDVTDMAELDWTSIDGRWMDGWMNNGWVWVIFGRYWE
jgi:hypothetical protein